MKVLVDKWRAEAVELERRAKRLDYERDYDSTYYSAMDAAQRERWNRLRDEAHILYVQRNLLNRLATELESAVTVPA